MIALLALASSAAWGTSDFCGGLFSRRYAAMRVVAISQLGGLIAISVVFAATVSVDGLPSGPWFGDGLCAGVCGCIALSCFYAALSAGTMGVISPISAMGALVPVAIGFATGNHVTIVVGGGMAVALIGAALASGPELSGQVSRRPVLLAVAAAVGFGLTFFFLDRGGATSVVGTLWAMRLASACVLFTTWRVRPKLAGATSIPRRTIPLVMAVGCIDLSANGLFALASSHGSLAVASVLGSLYPVATLAWARFVLHERLRAIQLVGVGLAVLGVALVAS